MDAFDFMGIKTATALVETLEMLETQPPAIRYPGITALEDFYLRLTGHDLDWETSRKHFMQTGEEYEDMNILDERAVYREETARWYKSGEEFKTPGVVAISYPEAFEMLYGHSMPMPANVRAQHKESVFA